MVSMTQPTRYLVALATCALLLLGAAAFGLAHAATEMPGPGTGALRELAPRAIYTVNTTSDASVPGGCTVVPTCSLRDAITAANGTPGLDVIAFNLGATIPQTITVLNALPDIVDTVLIDGYTQPGTMSNTLPSGTNAVLGVVISNGTVVSPTSGLRFTAGAANSTVRGLVVNLFTGDGIELQSALNISITGNFVGTDATGTRSLGNTAGGVALNTSLNNLIGGTTPAARNILSGNGFGVFILGATSTGNTIQGNLIGTDRTGKLVVPNRSDGVQLQYAQNNTVGGTVGTTPGGACSGACNVIAGNRSDGVDMEFGASGNVVQGNYIGVDVSGTLANDANGVSFGNNDNGVVIFGSPNETIGGNTPAARNILSNNAQAGVRIAETNSTGNLVLGNYVGTDVSGTADLGNFQVGVTISASFSSPDRNNQIGGTVGVTPGGCTGQCNIIAFNHGVGIEIGANRLPGIVPDPTGNQIRANSIHSNTGIGIDLGTNGVTPNDTGDADVGPNNYQNFPILASATSAGGNTTLVGSLNSLPFATFTLDAFSNPACDNSSAAVPGGPYGEGKTYLGSVLLSTGATGNANFVFSFPLGTAVGQFVTVTATDGAGNTSEFSNCIVVMAPSGTPPPTSTPANTPTPTSTATATPSPTATSTPPPVVPELDSLISFGSGLAGLLAYALWRAGTLTRRR